MGERIMTDEEARAESVEWWRGFDAVWRAEDARDPQGPILDRDGRPLADRWR